MIICTECDNEAVWRKGRHQVSACDNHRKEGMKKKDRTCRVMGCSSAASHNYINHTLVHPTEVEIELYKLVRNTEKCPKRFGVKPPIPLGEGIPQRPRGDLSSPGEAVPLPLGVDDSFADLSFRRSPEDTFDPELFGDGTFALGIEDYFFPDEEVKAPLLVTTPSDEGLPETSRARFDLLVNGTKVVEPRFCHHHSKPGMINVHAKLCSKQGCSNKSAYFKKGGTFCFRHREFGSVKDISADELKEKVCSMTTTIDKLQRELNVSESLRKKAEDMTIRYGECWLKQARIIADLQESYQKLYVAYQTEMISRNRLKGLHPRPEPF